jgi:hypothetical protein
MANEGIRLKYGSSFFDVQSNLVAGGRIPVPLMTVDTTANTDIDKNILSMSSNIQLEGIVLGTGIIQCMSAYSGILAYFADPKKQSQTFEVWCDDKVLASYSGTTLKSFNADKGTNNWVVTIPYTISLESITPSGSGAIESFEDNWTIEPLEEVYYFDYSKNSPLLQFSSSAPSTVNDKPPSPTDLSAGNINVNIKNFLQYRITHRISAVGKAIDRTNTANPSSGGSANTNNLKSQAYMEASKWVVDRAKNSYGPIATNYTGIKVNNDTSTNGLRLYNHMRSIESNVSAGSYSITDTWLAVATGVTFLEEFSWEISTDDKLIKTVTLNGTIKGLEATDGSEGYVVFPSGALTGNISKSFATSFPAQTPTNNRFTTAISGYQNGVKPFLYQRASLALASVDRPQPSTSAPAPVPWIGPAQWNRLNITPISYSETLSPVGGSVTYSVVYSNKPGPVISGALNTTFNIADTNPSDQIAEIFVLGRPLGPILEKVGTTKSERRFSLEAIFPVPTGFNQIHPNSPDCVIFPGKGATPARPEYLQMKQLVDAFKPISPNAFATLTATSPYGIANQGQVFKIADSTNWNPFEGRFSWDITWIYNTGVCS